MKRLATVVLCATLTVTAGCGSSGKNAAISSEATASVPSANTETGAAETGGNPVDAQAFCAFLKKTEPQLVQVGSTPGAIAQLAIALATWVETHPPPRTAADLDEAAKATCPRVRTRVVTLMGGTSFSDTLG